MDQLFNAGKGFMENGGLNVVGEGLNFIGGAMGTNGAGNAGGGLNSISEGIEAAKTAMEMFRKIDRNGDGKITEEDFVMITDRLGLGFLGKPIAKATFKQFDKNKNGKLEISEALEAYNKLQKIAHSTNQSI